MKKIKQAALTKLVKEKNLELTRGKTPANPKKKEPEKPDLASGIMIQSGAVVSEMASSLAESAGKISESSVLVAQIAKIIQESLKEKPVAIGETHKKRKWKFTPVRDYDRIITHIVVEEL